MASKECPPQGGLDIIKTLKIALMCIATLAFMSWIFVASILLIDKIESKKEKAQSVAVESPVPSPADSESESLDLSSSESTEAPQDDLEVETGDLNSPFIVTQDRVAVNSYNSFAEAVQAVKGKRSASVEFHDETVWSENLPDSFHIDGVPLILQLPELPRGCEVTSLAMLLNYAGVNVSKLELAHVVKLDPTPLSHEDDGDHYGNPHDGFVGDMYSLSDAGYGVYHEPIKSLADKYLPYQVYDMTGTDFDSVLYTVSKGTPVWVIVPMTYDTVPDAQWEEWVTPTGKVKITHLEHSVVIDGYDDKFVYIKDPYGLTSQVPRDAFQQGWEQMGKQAISYIGNS